MQVLRNVHMVRTVVFHVEVKVPSVHMVQTGAYLVGEKVPNVHMVQMGVFRVEGKVQDVNKDPMEVFHVVGSTTKLDVLIFKINEKTIHANTESAAMEALRKMYRSWDNFVILSIEWIS